MNQILIFNRPKHKFSSSFLFNTLYKSPSPLQRAIIFISFQLYTVYTHSGPPSPSSQTQRRNPAHTSRRLYLNTQHILTHDPQLHHLHHLYSNLHTHPDHHRLAATHILVTSKAFHTHSIWNQPLRHGKHQFSLQLHISVQSYVLPPPTHHTTTSSPLRACNHHSGTTPIDITTAIISSQSP